MIYMTHHRHNWRPGFAIASECQCLTQLVFNGLCLDRYRIVPQLRHHQHRGRGRGQHEARAQGSGQAEASRAGAMATGMVATSV